jgi:hypothetical protein
VSHLIDSCHGGWRWEEKNEFEGKIFLLTSVRYLLVYACSGKHFYRETRMSNDLESMDAGSTGAISTGGMATNAPPTGAGSTDARGLEGSSRAITTVGKAKELGGEQRAALDLLCSGKTVAQTAELAGISRATVYRWLKSDAVFQAAYNQWHDQMRLSGRSRLLMLVEKAVGALEKALEAGEWRAAACLVKGLGLLSDREPGPTDPAEVALMARSEERRRKRREEFEEMEGALGGHRVSFRRA